VGLKTHCKAILVVRQDYYGIKRYAHIGTGNYHSDTARLYSDLGLMTCDDQIGEDLTELFNYLTTGYKPNRGYKKLLPSPKMFKRALLDKIAREIEQHRPDAPGLIQIKVNALEDPDVIRALYRASAAGVRIDLIVRDTCRLRPGIPGLSDTITVTSVVGRFLEHTRAYYFQNGGDEEYFIGSADVMSRNLMNRVEIIVPVEAPELREELRFMLDTQLEDRRSAWEMGPDGSYVQRNAGSGKKAKGTHQALIEWAERRHKEATRLKRRKPRGLPLNPAD
jgi:polyphosphate kinase